MKKTVLFMILISFLNCTGNTDKPIGDQQDTVLQNTAENRRDTLSVSDKDTVLRILNDEILKTLQSEDYRKFGQYIHPEKGIRFSMYAFTSIYEDKHFSKADFRKYQPGKTVFTWGARDGSGVPYKATVNEYLSEWLFVKNFTGSEYSLNRFQGGGNSLNNLKEIYPDTDFTENFIKSTAKDPELDWHTLRLVFEEFEGKYYLVAAVNDRWTT